MRCKFLTTFPSSGAGETLDRAGRSSLPPPPRREARRAVDRRAPAVREHPVEDEEQSQRAPRRAPQRLLTGLNGPWRHNEARGDNGGQSRSLQRREEAEFREVQGTWSEGWGARIGGPRIKVSATIYYPNLALPPHTPWSRGTHNKRITSTFCECHISE
ncbi:unnamed protein product [Arctogadus glacialis]